MLDTLETLCCLEGVSGGEDEVRDYILERCMPFADEIKTDPMGDLIIFKKGAKKPQQRLLLCAHMDEVGLIVTAVTDEGMLRFDTVGGIDRRVLLAKRVFAGPQRVPGVIGTKPIHLVKKEEEDKIPPLDALYIDVGAQSREEAEALVSPGDLVVFDDTVTRFGDGFLKAKAIDDRVGCAALVKLIESELPCDCWFAFTVQEEVGCRGAGVAARIVEPDIAVILEGTTACDLPDVKGAARVCELGKGVVIPFMDKLAIYDRGLVARVTAAADAAGIPWQTKSKVAGGTDASAVQRAGHGARVLGLAVAVRGLHSPACVAKLSDCEALLRLSRLTLEELSR